MAHVTEGIAEFTGTGCAAGTGQEAESTECCCTWLSAFYLDLWDDATHIQVPFPLIETSLETLHRCARGASPR